MDVNKLVAKLAMINVMLPQENLLVGGQPTPADLLILQQMGITQVINLRPTSEPIEYDEKETCRQLQLRYHVIPVTDITSVTRDKAKKLYQLLIVNEPTLVHCASGNRVGALIALMAFWMQHCSAEDAFFLGEQSGLTKLAPEVKQLLRLSSC
ncbi:sulfur transferase domain-containing protein [Thalassotalea sp. 1_MG-2023]|uniref:phosphatase domain-containing protein n=1 Tax=Thalassotalea sp. 1_MG-2023 TaxID=3062680 RepID=UPI0026E12C6C|nr:sulfur transferase domain-containing protein [Thalassotalea sp. 1_MG-2023]MDO6428178.1 sulfur transferase domain-containing protein [Thalassotalea sp. 1_MG-2023]